VATLLIGANDRAVWVSGGAGGGSGGAGGVRSVATPLPILHWMLRERARAYGGVTCARHTATAAITTAASSSAAAAFDSARWVSLHFLAEHILSVSHDGPRTP